MEQVQQNFEQAVGMVSSGQLGKVSQDEQLELYALYSVVKKGAAPVDGPSVFLDPVGFAKWTAWSTLKYMEKDEAMHKYAHLVETISNAEMDSSKPENGYSKGTETVEGFGSKASTGFDISDETEKEADGETNVESKQDICYWAALGNVDEVQKCLALKLVSPNFRDTEGLTPLMRAVDRNETNVVDFLVSSGADLNLIDTEGQTALHYAAYCDHAELAGLLVMHGASVEVKDQEGMTPIGAASGQTLENIQKAKAGTFKRNHSGCGMEQLATRRWLDLISGYVGMDVTNLITACAVGTVALVVALGYRNRKLLL